MGQQSVLIAVLTCFRTFGFRTFTVLTNEIDEKIVEGTFDFTLLIKNCKKRIYCLKTELVRISDNCLNTGQTKEQITDVWSECLKSEFVWILDNH